MRLSTLLSSFFVVIGLVVAVFAGTNSYNTIKELQETRRYAEVGQATSTAMSATVAMSLERSVTQVSLALDDPAPQAFRDIIDAQRKAADQGLAEATQMIDEAHYLATSIEFVQQAQAAINAVATLRMEVDSLLSMPKSQRDPQRAYELPFELKANVVALRNTTDLLRNHLAMATPRAGTLDTVQQRAWEIREFAGRARTYFAIATATDQAISQEDKASILLDRQRAAEAYTALWNAAIDSEISEELLTEITNAEKTFFEDYEGLLDRLLKTSNTVTDADDLSRSYEINFADFFTVSNNALGLFEALSIAAGDELISYLKERERAAIIWTVVNCSLALLLVLAIIAVAYILNARVFLRLSRVTDTLAKVSEGNLDAEVQIGNVQIFEIKTLATAVSNIRDSQIALNEAQEKAERGAKEKAKAEAERKAAEDARAKEQAEQEARAKQQAEEARQEMIGSLSRSLGDVVAAASSGDFSKRVEAKFADEKLTALATDVNTLVENVQTGVTAVGAVLEKVANGDLKQEMTGEYKGAFKQLQGNTNQMISSLKELVTGISDSTHKLTQSSAELRDTSDVMTRQAEQNASALEMASSALTELSASIKAVDDNISDANTNAQAASETASTGRAVASEAALAMSRIDEASGEITKVVGVINEIAFQINLLALNAGVEAARAGEAGLGFSVVASEVRQLAQRASDASGEISAVISKSNDAVAEGVRKVTDAGTSLAKISDTVLDVSNSIDEIARATAEQVHGIKEINASVAQVDSNTRVQVGSCAEVTAASKLLAQEAVVLKAANDQFDVGAFGVGHTQDVPGFTEEKKAS